MSGLVGNNLEEMAKIQANRKVKIVSACSVVSLLILFFYGFIHISTGELEFGVLNLLCCVILCWNLYRLYKHKSCPISDLTISGVLLFQAVVMLLYVETVPDRVLWLYPILAAVIFINEFKYAALLSGGFCLLVTLATVVTQVIPLHESIAADRFLVSLFAMCLLANFSCYYFGKITDYLQSLYKEGIQDLAYRDQLTGLANRWSFENWAKQKLETLRNENSLTALVFLDIDDFKTINDTYGHEVGDMVLKHFANRLKNNLRNKDRDTNQEDYSIARFAGDEFVLLLYGVSSKEDLNSIMRRICRLFADSYQGSERINQLSLSAGLAIFKKDADTLEELTRCADKAMYNAKHSGKGRYCFYNEKPILGARDNLENEQSLKNVTPIKRVPSGSYT